MRRQLFGEDLVFAALDAVETKMNGRQTASTPTYLDFSQLVNSSEVFRILIAIRWSTPSTVTVADLAIENWPDPRSFTSWSCAYVTNPIYTPAVHHNSIEDRIGWSDGVRTSAGASECGNFTERSAPGVCAMRAASSP